MKILRRIAILSLVLMLAVSRGAGAADDILVNDFEATDYGDWKVECEAFGKSPAKGTLGGQNAVQPDVLVAD